MKGRLRKTLVLVVILGVFVASVSDRGAAQPLLLTRHGVSAGSIFLPLIANNYPLPPTIFGIQLDSISQTEVDLLDPVRTSWVGGLTIPWNQVEPTVGVRNWTALTAQEAQMLRVSQKTGLKVVANVRFTPDWAQKISGTTCGPMAPDYYDEFGNFLYDLVSRYSGYPYNVKIWEIWNEPDVDPALVGPDSPFGCWGDPAATYYGGQAFGEMLKVVYPRIKAADPNATVLVGGLLLDCDPVHPPVGKDCSSARFLEGILAAGAGNFFDGISFHAYDYYAGALGKYSNPNWHTSWQADSSDPYSQVGPAAVAKAKFIQSVLDNYNVQDKELLNTESALLCDSCASDTGFEQTKAIYLAHSYILAHNIPNLKANIWYTLHGWRNSGLLDSSAQPNQAFQAYDFAAGLIGRATVAGTLPATLPNGVQGLRFYDESREIWALWYPSTTPVNASLPALPDQIFDLVGQSVTVSQTIALDVSPKYIVWNSRVSP